MNQTLYTPKPTSPIRNDPVHGQRNNSTPHFPVRPGSIPQTVTSSALAKRITQRRSTSFHRRAETDSLIWPTANATLYSVRSSLGARERLPSFFISFRTAVVWGSPPTPGRDTSGCATISNGGGSSFCVMPFRDSISAESVGVYKPEETNARDILILHHLIRWARQHAGEANKARK